MHLFLFQYKKPLVSTLLLGCLLIITSCTTNPTYEKNRIISDEDSEFILNKTKNNTNFNKLLRKNKDEKINESIDILLEILTAAVNEKNWSASENILKEINSDDLNSQQLTQYSIDASQYWIAKKQFNMAREWLSGPAVRDNFSLMSNNEKVNILMLRAEVLFIKGQMVSSLYDRILLNKLSDNPKQKKYNQRKIWTTSLKLTKSSRENIIKKNKFDTISGWLTLASIHYDYMSGKEKQLLKISEWQSKWFNHPANNDLPSDIRALFLQSKEVKEIAMLIPLSGPLENAGKAIQEGMHASYFTALEENWNLPVIVNYDTNKDSITNIHQKIRQSNTDLIIGPLQKELLTELAQLENQIPIIALNYLNEKKIKNKNLIQFGLASEDEAKQLAFEAIQDGHQNAIILQTDFDWANRASESFKKKWQALGGKVVNHTILSSEKNYSKQIAESLSLDKSSFRHNKIEKIIGEELGFLPRRRQDFDVFIIFSNNDQIHAIKPLLDYHYSSGIEVYGSSHINDSVEGKSYRDLNGIIFNEIPWLLDDKKNNSIAPIEYYENKQLGRLFALGSDVFYIHKNLDQLRYSHTHFFAGKTGDIYLNENRLIRKLDMAYYKRGKIKKLPSSTY